MQHNFISDLPAQRRRAYFLPSTPKKISAIGHVRMDFGRSEGRTLLAYPEAVKVVYPRTLLTAENAAKLPCEQVLGAYTVTFER